MGHCQKTRYIAAQSLGGLVMSILSGGLASCQSLEGAVAPGAEAGGPQQEILLKTKTAVETGAEPETGAVSREEEPGEEGWKLPQVQGDRLLLDLSSWTGQRYWSEERAQVRQRLAEQLIELGWEVEAQRFEAGSAGMGVNLVATYSERGVEPQPVESILVGAHYDTVRGSPGSDDNATGMAVLLELARLYVDEASGLQGSRALTLVFFDLEEQGLSGSLAFTAQSENLQSLHSAVILDMLGASCGEPGCQRYPEGLAESLFAGEVLSDVGDFIAVVGETSRLDLLSVFGGETASPATLPDVLRVPVPFKGLLTPDVLRSDHAPFWLNGVGAVLVTDTANLRNPHYHQPSDDLENIDTAFFVGAAQRVVDGVWRLLVEPQSDQS